MERLEFTAEKRAVHLAVLCPISSVHVWYVEIIALVTPAFVEDLFELGLRIEIHPETEIQFPLTGLRRIFVCVNQIERRHRRLATKTAASATACGAINQLVAIGANGICRDTVDESRCFAVTKPVSD